MWFLFALISSVFLAASAEVNRVMRLDGLSLNLWRTIFAALLFLPFLPFMYWPQTFWFYVISALDGIVSVATMAALLNLSAKGESRVSAMYLPIASIFAFIFWYFLHPSMFINVIQKPLAAIGIFASIFIALLGLQLIRKNNYSWKSFLIVAPIGITFGAVDLLTKVVITEDMPTITAALTYAFVSFSITGLGSIPFIVVRRKTQNLFCRKIVLTGLLSGALSAIAFVCAIIAIVFALNPAYPGVIAMNVPVMLYALHATTGVKDDASPIASMLIVLSAIGLLLFG